MSNLPPAVGSKSNRKLYLYDSDWAEINEYFAMTAGTSTLTKTKAIRELIHNWVISRIRPRLDAARQGQRQALLDAPKVSIDD